jgi:hypothetical protein
MPGWFEAESAPASCGRSVTRRRGEQYCIRIELLKDWNWAAAAIHQWAGLATARHGMQGGGTLLSRHE